MTANTERLTAALADRYKVVRRLGEGGMATVYLAEDLKHERQVALKVLRPELAAVLGAERFVQEIKTTANLQHPHILPLFDSGTAGQRDGGTEFLYYVMPFIDGETLRDKLDRETQLGVDEAARITTEIADALDYAHRHGVIHRDIKPENILLHDGRPMVADFGIALAVSAASGGRMTETGLSLGTPHYMSPEQATAEKDLTAKADIYSLGSVLYEMLTGDPPHTGSSAQQIIMKIVTDEVRPVTELRKSVPPNAAAAVAKSLEKLPADRFATASEFRDALQNTGFAITDTGATGPVSHAVQPYSASTYGRVTTAVAIVSTALAAWGWLNVRGGSEIRVTREYVTFGDSVAPRLDQPSMDLSPDGTLVFRDDGLNGALWVRQPDELNPVRLPGTEGATNPIFSPDGKWIAFVQQRLLKKIPVAGGAAVTLADSAVGGYGGAAWLDDGRLVYVAPSLNRMFIVNEAGGTSRAVLGGGSLRGGGIGVPVALPNSRGVLFQYCSSGCVTNAVHVLDLRTETQKLLLEGVVQAWYLPGGRLFFVRRDGAGMVAPFDLDRLEITGEALPVLDGVEVNSTLSGNALLTWSQSGSLLYAKGPNDGMDITAVRVSRDGTISRIDSTWAGLLNSLALSPDGTRLAVGNGLGSAVNIWVKRLDQGPFTRLTFGNTDRRPVWVPGGGLVAFLRDSDSTTTVFTRAADGSGAEKQVVHLEDLQVQEAAWSPDGQWVIVRTDNAGPGGGDLLGVRVDSDSGAVPLVATRFTELHPQVSPDGRWLAYVSNESGRTEVYVRPFPETERARWQVSNSGGQQPVWAPDDDELFFLDPDNRLISAEFSAGSTFSVRGRTQLFDASAFSLDNFHQSYVATENGFIFLAPAQVTGSRERQFVRVENWLADVEERLSR